MPERRRSLTPFGSELRATEERIAPAAPGMTTRLRRRLRREPPKTVAGAFLHGLVRLVVATSIASGIALLVDHWLGRSQALGFYLVGGVLLAVAFSTSSGMAGQMGGWYFFEDAGDREHRFNLGIAYIIAGAAVIGLGVLIEALGRP